MLLPVLRVVLVGAGLCGLALGEDPDSTPPPPPPPQSMETAGNSSEAEPLALPTFTYAATEDDIKEAAYKAGVAIRGEPAHQLQLPASNVEARLSAEPRWNSYYTQQRRRQFQREYQASLVQARLAHGKKMLRICYQRCNQYINETFERPDLSAASNASLLLEQMDMGSFPAAYLTMTLEEMGAITAENCEQWEADYQCIFGCTADAGLIDRMKRGLAGDFHLTANVECPNPAFARFLPCVGEKAGDWVGPCERRLIAYQQLKAQTNGRVLALERLSQQLAANYTLAKESGRMFLGSLNAYLVPYAMQVQREQTRLCSAYGELLMCALAGLRRSCSERAASFVHTSLAENFATNVLQGKSLVKQQLGGLSSTCMQLANKATFRLFPIKK